MRCNEEVTSFPTPDPDRLLTPPYDFVCQFETYVSGEVSRLCQESTE